jgi:hypothetical protein
MKSGDVIGSWTVIEDVSFYQRNNKRGMLLCRCVCGVEKKVWKSHLEAGDSKSCGCKRPGGKSHYKWTGCGELDGNHWNQIVRNATGKKGRAAFAMTITIEDAWNLFLTQDRKCALTGLQIQLGNERTASLDRIDSSLGYVYGNVQWVHKDINRMKNTLPQGKFVALCHLVSENSRQTTT